MENKNEIVVVSEIDQALAKENVTEQVIANLKASYGSLTIAGVDDKNGYDMVKLARYECRDLRILAVKIAKKGREHANAVSKAWINKEKEIVAQISEVEDYLQEQQDAIDNIEKIALEKRATLRREQLHAVEYHGDWTDISTVSDEVFNLILGSATKDYEGYVADMKAQEEEKKAEEDRLEKQRLEQAEEKRLLDEQKEEQERVAREQKAESDRIEREKKQIEDDKIKAEEDKKRAVEIEEAKEKSRLQAIEDEKERLRIKELEDKETERKLQEAEDKRLALLPDLEKLALYAEELSNVTIPDVKSIEANHTLTEANRYIVLALNLLEGK